MIDCAHPTNVLSFALNVWALPVCLRPNPAVQASNQHRILQLVTSDKERKNFAVLLGCTFVAIAIGTTNSAVVQKATKEVESIQKEGKEKISRLKKKGGGKKKKNPQNNVFTKIFFW